MTLKGRTSLALVCFLVVQVVALAAAPAALANHTISGFSPTSGPVGTSVTISGTNFENANQVSFNGTNATFTVNQAGTQITATVPNNATTGRIAVSVPSDGTVTSASDFIVTTNNPPTITSFTPTSGAEGTLVTINGTDLHGATAVRFGGVNATNFTVVSPVRITATVPNGADTGAIQVVTPRGTATSSSAFVVTPDPPTISSFSPTSGAPGTSVQINGTNLTNVSAVRFNGVNATFTVNNSGRITATVPAGATTGRITVVTANGTATSATDFTVTPGAPTISSLTPSNGAVGSNVIITGTGFNGTITVRFDGVAAPFTVNSPTQITATVPTGATTGRVTVTTSNGTATSPADFTVTRTPTVSSFTPSSGPAGTSVTINGSNFTSITSVTFNGVASTFTVNSSSRITATVPTGATTGRIGVTNSAGTGTSSTHFTVQTPPTISSFTPTFGRAGTPVVLTGTNFAGATGVSFDGEATTFTVDSATQITTVVPAGATTGRIVVTGPSGAGTSAVDFVVTQVHRRSVTLRLRSHLIAHGQVGAAGGPSTCVSGVRVFVQRRIGRVWETVRIATTVSDGAWAVRMPDARGLYRAVLPRIETPADLCRAAGSNWVRHRH
ncbi:MAG: beta strand repeat-containing protein [Actinomycetota bacterium]